VLGHSQCGAVIATLEQLRDGARSPSSNIRAIVDRVRPAIEGLLRTSLAGNETALLREAVRANVRASADHLRHGSALLEELIRDQGLLIVGAEYSLETGEVEFFDGLPEG
jgi:carbonic anhydrase